MASKKSHITPSLILQARTYNENDILVDFLTPDLGRLKGVARHGRKSQKRFSTLLDTMNLVNLTFKDQTGWVQLEEAGQLEFYFQEASYEMRLIGYYILDVVRSFLPERQADGHSFELVCDTLRELDQLKYSLEAETRRFLLQFLSRFLKLCGYGLTLSRCRDCRRTWEIAHPFYFVYREGAIFCEECVPAGGGKDTFLPEKAFTIINRFIEMELGRSLPTSKFLSL